MRHRLLTPLLLALLLPGCPSRPEPEVGATSSVPVVPQSAAPSIPPPPPPPAPPPPPVPTAAAAPADALDGFAGFSRDGKSFAWVAPSALDPETRFLKIISQGGDDPKLASADRGEAGVKEGLKTLAKDGFTRAKGPVPPGVTLETNLTVKPPTAAVVLGTHRIAFSVGQYPYPPTDVAELWGTSADGKHLAVYIHGRDVPGVFSKGQGGEYHFYFVVAVP